jgi:hypothetical protein
VKTERKIIARTEKDWDNNVEISQPNYSSIAIVDRGISGLFKIFLK